MKDAQGTQLAVGDRVWPRYMIGFEMYQGTEARIVAEPGSVEAYDRAGRMLLEVTISDTYQVLPGFRFQAFPSECLKLDAQPRQGALL